MHIQEISFSESTSDLTLFQDNRGEMVVLSILMLSSVVGGGVFFQGVRHFAQIIDSSFSWLPGPVMSHCICLAARVNRTVQRALAPGRSADQTSHMPPVKDTLQSSRCSVHDILVSSKAFVLPLSASWCKFSSAHPPLCLSSMTHPVCAHLVESEAFAANNTTRNLNSLALSRE